MKKTIVYLVLISIIVSCSEPPKEKGHPAFLIQGEAQGTTYSIKYLSANGEVLNKASIDSLLKVLDLSLSVWVEASIISAFNKSDSIATADEHFLTVFFRGREISELTGGAFHPMVMPLVRAWGFGPEGGQIKDGINIDSVRTLVTYDYSVEPSDNLPGTYLFVKPKGVQLDVNAYAQGYAVDMLAAFAESKGLSDYMVEIGGELTARGRNQDAEPWRIGIDKPVAEDAEREMKAIVALNDMAMATSGNYRKFYIKDGNRYPHTIDPATGYPVSHKLMSATVLASNCTNADAFATAFLVMGDERTKEFLAGHPELKLEVYLISDGGGGNWITWASEGMKQVLKEVE